MGQFEDEAALRRLASLYCTAVDDGDADAMAGLFIPQGSLIVYPAGTSWGATPLRRWDQKQGFQKLIETLRQSYSKWVHFLGNHWADVRDGEAVGEAYLFACHLKAQSADPVEETAIIRYRDFYVRIPEGWRFRERHAFRQWTTSRPIGQSPHLMDVALSSKPK